MNEYEIKMISQSSLCTRLNKSILLGILGPTTNKVM